MERKSREDFHDDFGYEVYIDNLFEIKNEILKILKMSEKAIQAAHKQTDAEWRNHALVEEKCDKIIIDFRNRRDAVINKARTE